MGGRRPYRPYGRGRFTQYGRRPYQPRGPRRYPQRRFNNRRPFRGQRRPQQKREVADNIIYVKNLAYAIKEEELKEEFKAFNPVEVTIPTYKKGEEIRSKGYAFVTVADAKKQEEAIKAMNAKEIKGRKIYCKKGFKKNEKPQTTEKQN